MTNDNAKAVRKSRERRKASGLFRYEWWVHKDADLDAIKRKIEIENNKAIAAQCNRKTDKRELLK